MMMPKSNNNTGLLLVELCSHPAMALVAPPPTLGLSLPQLSQHSHKEPVVTVRPAAQAPALDLNLGRKWSQPEATVQSPG